MSVGNLKFKNALQRTPQAIPPIWFMRQAGRYHQHYQALKEKHSFIELCRQPELAAEVTAGPIDEFDFDVAILFSDLLFPLEALGMGLDYQPGPVLGWQLTPDSLSRLKPWQEAAPALYFQHEAVKACRARIPKNKSLIGFVGGPWTLFAYAVDGGHDGHLLQTKRHLNLFAPFCEILLPLLEQNIRWQFAAGAEVVMLFDTAAGELSPALYLHHVAPALEVIAKKFPGQLGYYAKGTCGAHYQHPLFSQNLFAGMGFDHRWDLRQSFAYGQGFVQGNFDQALLFAETSDFRRHLNNYLQIFKDLTPSQRAGWVCGLGHGVLPKTPQAHVKEFVQTVREFLA